MASRTASNALGAFLARARAALHAPAALRPTPLTFVVGNESADLDSLCSALVYAYFRSCKLPHPSLHIPLSNLPRADLALRPELAAALAHARLTPSDLLTLDDVPPSLEPSSTRWLLVDHNVLTGTLAEKGFKSKIVGCIDHHADEGVIPPGSTGDEPRVIEKTGSCMSLVVEQCRSAWKEGDVDGQIARVALAAILVDTAGLGAADRTTEKDVQAAKFLEGMVEAGYERGQYFNELSAMKEDLSGLTFRDIFRKDYKRWEEEADGGGSVVLGISSVPQGLEYLVDGTAKGDEGQLLDAFREWAQEQRLDIGAIMTTLRPEGAFQRELLVWGFNQRACVVAEDFVKRHGEELGLEAAWEEGKLDAEQTEDGTQKGSQSEWRRAWRQMNIAHSRKRVAPMLRESIKKASRL